METFLTEMRFVQTTKEVHYGVSILFSSGDSRTVRKLFIKFEATIGEKEVYQKSMKVPGIVNIMSDLLESWR